MTGLDSPSLSRREARRRDRREAILAVAARSFLKHGYAATTMSGIAATLGGSKGTLWNHFPTKEALFAAFLDDATTAYRARLTQLLNLSGELEPTLRQLGASLLEKVTSPDSIALHRLVVSEAGRFPEMGAIFHERAPKQTRAVIADFLARAMDQGLLRRADPTLAAQTFISLLLSGCHQLLLMGQIEQASPEQIEADVAFGVDCFLHAFAASPEPAH